MSAILGNGSVTFGDSTVQNAAWLGQRASLHTGNGTFTIPTGVTAIKVTIVGGGGSGGSISTGYAAGGCGGGGGGATAIKFLTGLTPGLTISVPVGGAGGASSIASGTQTITTVTAGAGSSVSGINSNAIGAAGGTTSSGNLNINGAHGFNGLYFPNDPYAVSGAGGQSTMGFGGPFVVNTSNSTNGVAGKLYGGGGSGSAATATAFGGCTGGSGAAGVVLFEW